MLMSLSDDLGGFAGIKLCLGGIPKSIFLWGCIFNKWNSPMTAFSFIKWSQTGSNDVLISRKLSCYN